MDDQLSNEASSSSSLEPAKKNIPADFPGDIKYYSDIEEIAVVGHELLTAAQNVCVAGFDIEWTVIYGQGPSMVDLIQICLDPECCYLLQVTGFEELPDSLVEFLAHPNVILTGVNVKADITRLGNSFKIDKTKIDGVKNNCVDTSLFAKEIFGEKGAWKMKDLAEKFLGVVVNKDNDVRIGNWDRKPLLDNQRKYAAIDAFISLELYKKLKEMELDQELADQMLEQSINKGYLPLLRYRGQVHWCANDKEYEESCQQIINLANQKGNNEYLVLGFDKIFKKDEFDLIQLSTTLDTCYLFKLSDLQSLPACLLNVLKHPKVRLAGFSVNRIISDISKKFSIPNIEELNSIDLTQLSKQLMGPMKAAKYDLIKSLLNYRMDEDIIKKFTWNTAIYSNKQQNYAAQQSYVALKLYEFLKEKETQLNKEKT